MKKLTPTKARKMYESGNPEEMGKALIYRFVEKRTGKEAPFSLVIDVNIFKSMNFEEKNIWNGYFSLCRWLNESTQMAGEQLGVFKMGVIAFQHIADEILNNIIPSPDGDPTKATLKTTEPITYCFVTDKVYDKETLFMPLDRACAYLYGHNKLLDIFKTLYGTVSLKELSVIPSKDIDEFLELVEEELGGFLDLYWNNPQVKEYLQREFAVFKYIRKTTAPSKKSVAKVKKLLEKFFEKRTTSEHWNSLIEVAGQEACYIFWNDEDFRCLEGFI